MLYNMSLFKLTWDIRSQFLMFKDYYLNEDTLFETVLYFVQDQIKYPLSIRVLGDEDERMEKQQELFSGIIDSIMRVVVQSLEESETLTMFKNILTSKFRSNNEVWRYLIAKDSAVEILYIKMLQEFIEKT